MFSQFDHDIMRRVFELAQRGAGCVSPNPLVGCVLVKNENIVSEGYHQWRGSNHAEVNAIIKADPTALEGATLYTNLEPCCHTNKLTRPCTELIIDSGIKKVIIANLDPNPQVCGKGLKILEDKGIEVHCGLLEKEGEYLNKIFFKNMKEGMPYVHLKVAASLDGRIATDLKDSKWITDFKARTHAHLLRKNYDSIAIGSSTLRTDNPDLRVRNVPTIRDKHTRIIFSSDDRLNRGYIAFENQDKVKTIVISGHLKHVLQDLFSQGIHSILVEGGAKLISSFVDENLFDELTIYNSPILLGNGPSLFKNILVERVKDAPRLNLQDSFLINDQVVSSYTRMVN